MFVQGFTKVKKHVRRRVVCDKETKIGKKIGLQNVGATYAEAAVCR